MRKFHGATVNKTSIYAVSKFHAMHVDCKATGELENELQRRCTNLTFSPNTLHHSPSRDAIKKLSQNFSCFHAQLWMVGGHKLARALLHWACFY